MSVRRIRKIPMKCRLRRFVNVWERATESVLEREGVFKIKDNIKIIFFSFPKRDTRRINEKRRTYYTNRAK